MSVSEKGCDVIRIGNSKTAANIYSALLPQFAYYNGILRSLQTGVRMTGLLILFSDDHDDPRIYNIALVNMVLSKYLLLSKLTS